MRAPPTARTGWSTRPTGKGFAIDNYGRLLLRGHLYRINHNQIWCLNTWKVLFLRPSLVYSYYIGPPVTNLVVYREVTDTRFFSSVQQLTVKTHSIASVFFKEFFYPQDLCRLGHPKEILAGFLLIGKRVCDMDTCWDTDAYYYSVGSLDCCGWIAQEALQAQSCSNSRDLITIFGELGREFFFVLKITMCTFFAWIVP